jgi:Transposase
MKKSKFTEGQIAFALRQGDLGTPVADVCRKMGVSEATYFHWKLNAKAVASVATSPVLRDGDMTGRVDHRQYKCVLMSVAVYKYMIKKNYA